MTTVGKLLFEFIWFDLGIHKLFTWLNLFKARIAVQK